MELVVVLNAIKMGLHWPTFYLKYTFSIFQEYLTSLLKYPVEQLKNKLKLYIYSIRLYNFVSKYS